MISIMPTRFKPEAVNVVAEDTDAVVVVAMGGDVAVLELQPKITQLRLILVQWEHYIQPEMIN